VELPPGASLDTLLDCLRCLTNRGFTKGAVVESGLLEDGSPAFVRIPFYTTGQARRIDNGFNVVYFSKGHPSHPGCVVFNAAEVYALLSQPALKVDPLRPVKPLAEAVAFVSRLVSDPKETPLSIAGATLEHTLAYLRTNIPLFFPGWQVPANFDRRLVYPTLGSISDARTRSNRAHRLHLSDVEHARALFEAACGTPRWCGYFADLRFDEAGLALVDDGVAGARLAEHVVQHFELCLLSDLGLALLRLYGRIHFHLDGCYKLVDSLFVVFTIAVSGGAALSSHIVSVLVTSDERSEVISKWLRFVFEKAGLNPAFGMADMGLAEVKAIRAVGSVWSACDFHIKQALVVHFRANQAGARDRFLALFNLAAEEVDRNRFRARLEELDAFVEAECPSKVKELWRTRYRTVEYVRAWAAAFRPDMHPMVNTNMSLEAIFSVFQNPLDIGKAGHRRVGQFVEAILGPVYDYEVLKLQRVTTERQPPLRFSAAVRARAGVLIRGKLMTVIGTQVLFPSVPDPNLTLIDFSEQLMRVESNLATLSSTLEVGREGTLPSRSSARVAATAETTNATASLRQSTADFCHAVERVVGPLSDLILGDGDAEGGVAPPQLGGARGRIEALGATVLAQAGVVADGGHQAAEVVRDHVSAIMEDTASLLSSLGRVVKVLAGGPQRAPQSFEDAEHVLDLSTFGCSCPSCSLPVLSGRLCKQILAAAHGRALTADRFNSLVAEVAAAYRQDLWEANEQGVPTLNICGHNIISLGGGVFSCGCNYMACALGRLCLFPFCPALTFLMIPCSSAGYTDAAERCLKFSGTEVGVILDRFWGEKVSGEARETELRPVHLAHNQGEPQGLVPVRNPVGRRKKNR
jgi:hypothetical protein